MAAEQREGRESNVTVTEPIPGPSKEKEKEIILVAPDPTSTRPAPLSTQVYYASLLSLAALSLWMRTGFPVQAVVDAPHDDLLFVRLAHYLRIGA